MTPTNPNWMTVCTASAQGAYPVGSAVAQPDLSMAIPQPEKGLVNFLFQQRLLISMGRSNVAVLNAGIGGNQVHSPLSIDEPWRGGPVDGLHPNRAGHAAMANEILKAII